MKKLELNVVGVGKKNLDVKWVFNAGYAGCDSEQVLRHIKELQEIGVPAPKTFPTLYPVGIHAVSQGSVYQAPHDKTSGEAEWALLFGENVDEHLLIGACDHTDRLLETHGVAWSKQIAPDFIGDTAWIYQDVKEAFADFSLKAWVKNDAGTEEMIQNGAPSLLLSPSFWIDKLEQFNLAKPGTLLLSGTIPMINSVNQFSDSWHVELSDNNGNVSRVFYQIERMPVAWE